jgi:hypothetical protein
MEKEGSGRAHMHTNPQIHAEGFRKHICCLDVPNKTVTRGWGERGMSCRSKNRETELGHACTAELSYTDEDSAIHRHIYLSA